MTAKALGQRTDGGSQWLTPNGDRPANGSPSGHRLTPNGGRGNSKAGIVYSIDPVFHWWLEKLCIPKHYGFENW